MLSTSGSVVLHVVVVVIIGFVRCNVSFLRLTVVAYDDTREEREEEKEEEKEGGGGHRLTCVVVSR